MKLPKLNAKEIITPIEKKGFVLVRQSGSHRIYRNDKGVRITVSFHGTKTLHPKIMDAELTEEDLK